MIYIELNREMGLVSCLGAALDVVLSKRIFEKRTHRQSFKRRTGVNDVNNIRGRGIATTQAQKREEVRDKLGYSRERRQKGRRVGRKEGRSRQAGRQTSTWDLRRWEQ